MELLFEHYATTTTTTDSQSLMSPYLPEIIDLTESDDDGPPTRSNDETDDDDNDLPPLRSIFMGPCTRRNTFDMSKGGDTLQEHNLYQGETLVVSPEGPHQFVSQVSDVNQSHLQEVVSSPQPELCESPESPSEEYATVNESDSNITTQFPEPSQGADTITGPDSQHEALRRDGHAHISSRRQSDLQQGDRHVSQEPDIYPELQGTEDRDHDDRALVDVSNAKILGVYGERPTSQGREFACLVEIWLRPEVGIPNKHIHEYRTETVRRGRMQSLRKRKHENAPHAADMRALKRIQCWEKCPLSDLRVSPTL